jgi:hypothetical protein
MDEMEIRVFTNDLDPEDVIELLGLTSNAYIEYQNWTNDAPKQSDYNTYHDYVEADWHHYNTSSHATKLIADLNLNGFGNIRNYPVINGLCMYGDIPIMLEVTSDILADLKHREQFANPDVLDRITHIFIE